jgi:tetratricopeptide (TPR) repeat protein
MLNLTRSSEGMRLLSSGQVQEAIRAFESALGQDPKDVKCLLGLARAQILAGNAPAALGTFQKIFAIRPDHLEAKSHLGLLLAAMGDAKGAKALEEAAKDRRCGYWEHVNFGLYLAGRDDDRAQKEFEAATRSEARETLPYVQLGKIAERRKDMRSALRHYLKASEVAMPHDPMPWVLRARAHRELDEKPAAVLAVTEALIRLPKPDENRQVLSDGLTKQALFAEAFQLCMEAQQYENAVKVAVTALEHEPENAEYQGWMHEASAGARQAAPNRPRRTTTFEATDASLIDAEALTKKAEEYLFRKPPALNDCLQTIEPVLRIKPNDQRANITKAVALAVGGKKKEALPFAQKALAGEDKAIIQEANQLIKVINARLAGK